MSSRLTPFSYCVLALVGEGGASPHEIVQMMRRGRAYWTTSESHYYAEPKRLERMGYLRSEVEPGVTRERRRYRLTEEGRTAIREWLAEPSGFPRIQHEGIARLLARDLGDDESLLGSLRHIREDLEAVAAGIEDGERMIASLPHRAPQLALVHSLGRRLVRAHEDWLDEVERTLRP